MYRFGERISEIKDILINRIVDLINDGGIYNIQSYFKFLKRLDFHKYIKWIQENIGYEYQNELLNLYSSFINHNNILFNNKKLALLMSIESWFDLHSETDKQFFYKTSLLNSSVIDDYIKYLNSLTFDNLRDEYIHQFNYIPRMKRQRVYSGDYDIKKQRTR